MSFFPGKDPAPGDAPAADAIDLIVVPRTVDVGHFAVRRALPHAKRRMVGSVHLLRSFRTGRVPRRPRDRRAAASPYRPCHRHLPVRRRDHASRQPWHRRGDPSGRSQLDDRGPRHRSFRAHRARSPQGRRADPRPAVLGGAAGIATRRPSRASRTTTARRFRSSAARARPCASSPAALRCAFTGADALGHAVRRCDARGGRDAAGRRRHRGARAST